MDADTLVDIADVARDLSEWDQPLSWELVARLWDACHDAPDDDYVTLESGGVSITVDRQDRRAAQARRSDVSIRRGLEG